MRHIIFAIALLSLAASPALALTCAHVETGQALDPAPCDTIGQYRARFSEQASRGWFVVIVPDGTKHNAAAKQDRDGYWTTINPTVPPTRP